MTAETARPLFRGLIYIDLCDDKKNGIDNDTNNGDQ